jgi:hypothetical protein
LFVAKGNPQNEIASFQAHQPQKLAISNQLTNQKSTRDQPFRHFFTADYFEAQLGPVTTAPCVNA